ncbi:hypothetical protein ACS0TY_008166 [Phlomoides rotata]
MDNNHVNARPKNRFWVGSCVLFVFWYLLLYGFDWSSLPGISSLSHDQLNSLQSGSDHRNKFSGSVDSTISSEPDDDPQSTGSDPDPVPESDDYAKRNNSGNFIPNDTVEKIENEQKPVHDSNETIQDLEGLEQEVELSLPKDEEKEREAEEQIRIKKLRAGRSCTDRYIYIYDIPSRYNTDYIKQCKLLNKWHDMCQYFTNDGLGERLGNPQRLFQDSGWYVTNQFSLEVIFHNRMKQYECLTNDSSQASAIYVPYYPGLDVSRYLWDDDENNSKKDADSTNLFNLLREKPEWKAMGGKDHFLVSGRITWDLRRVDDKSHWGSKLMVLPESQNMSILTIESSPWDKNDFAIPYPTYFHPSTDRQIHDWQEKMRRQRRRSLLCFAGAPRPGMQDSIRDEIMAQCTASRRRCRMLECKNDRNNCLKPANVMRMFQNSIFCLQPPGDSFTRRSTFDSILAGCIPVFFTPGSAYVQYLWHLPKDFRSYSVLIPEGDVKQKRVSIDGVLSRISKTRIAAMRENVIRLIPNVVYADPRSTLEKTEDAFELTIKGVIERVGMLKREMREGRNYSAEFDSVTPRAIGSTVVELSRTGSRIGVPLSFRISSRSYAVPTTADAAAHDGRPLTEGLSCIFVGPVETASQETLEALYRQAREAYYSGEPLIVDDMFDRVELKLRCYGSKYVVKYPRCSLKRHSTYADAEEDPSQVFALASVWLLILCVGSSACLVPVVYTVAQAYQDAFKSGISYANQASAIEFLATLNGLLFMLFGSMVGYPIASASGNEYGISH